jgi:hypothetical protein
MPADRAPRPWTIDRVSDDVLLSIAETCSNRGVALAAEMALRRRYPSKVRVERGVRRTTKGATHA